MVTSRRYVRLWAMAWFVLQAASLVAFVPRDCCAPHRPVAKAPACHETPRTEAQHCPMRGADGAPCPMHSDQAATEAQHDHGDTRRSSSGCAMRGTYGGPQLFTVFSSPGIPVATATGWFLADPLPAVADIREHPLAHVQPPDLPPPRA